MAAGSKNHHRGRPYALMLLLAFSAAMLGVMILHKLREKRLFNILVQEKDQEMASLQFQLQKEKESVKELKRKIEELKTKTASLRSYKAGLAKKLMEMQSLMISLKEDQRSLELAIEERENRIKSLAQKESNATEGNVQARALIEILKQKETEIAELKHRLEKPTNNVWPYNPSNLPFNVPVVGNSQGQDENAARASLEAEAFLKTGLYADKNGIEGGDDLSEKMESYQDGKNLGRKGGIGEKDADGVQGNSKISENFVGRTGREPRNANELNEKTEGSADGQLNAHGLKDQATSGHRQMDKIMNSRGEAKKPSTISEKMEMPKDLLNAANSRLI